MKISYCAYDGFATLHAPGEAWWFNGGEWKQIDSADVSMKAAVIGRDAFVQRFGQLPALPAIAF